ncbi:hypothetical protein WN944_016991 [Citrus x changshan-huyou]|uniref:Uncharacterized protein n=1 Tax=Citrus x changshan-huyou TaxID=2935761 RepID=A0AAP0QP43_9ROSI
MDGGSYIDLIRRRRRGAAENGENGGGGNLMIRVARLDLRGSDMAGTTRWEGRKRSEETCPFYVEKAEKELKMNAPDLTFEKGRSSPLVGLSLVGVVIDGNQSEGYMLYETAEVMEIIVLQDQQWYILTVNRQ